MRIWAVYAVLLLHAGMTYMVGAPAWWYVIDRNHSFLSLSCPFVGYFPHVDFVFCRRAFLPLLHLTGEEKRVSLSGKFAELPYPGS
jgi:hypothetical protein